ncbi:hypothetical protein QOT17_022602 [Balamuthia mandrillaris]
MLTPSHSEDLSPAFPGTFPSLELKNKETKKSLPNPEPLSFLGCLLNYKYFSYNQEHTDEQTKKQHTHKHTCFLPLIKYSNHLVMEASQQTQQQQPQSTATGNTNQPPTSAGGSSSIDSRQTTAQQILALLQQQQQQLQ